MGYQVGLDAQYKINLLECHSDESQNPEGQTGSGFRLEGRNDISNIFAGVTYEFFSLTPTYSLS